MGEGAGLKSNMIRFYGLGVLQADGVGKQKVKKD
jgi:hypothetical protein